VDFASPEHLRQRINITNPAANVTIVRTVITTNILTDFTSVRSSDTKKLAPTDVKKIARFKNVEAGPPLSEHLSDKIGAQLESDPELESGSVKTA
jgi:hypothetical protein